MANNRGSPFIKTRSHAQKVINDYTAVNKSSVQQKNKSSGRLSTPENKISYKLNKSVVSIKTKENENKSIIELKNKIKILESENKYIKNEVQQLNSLLDIVKPSWLTDEPIRQYFDILSRHMLPNNHKILILNPVVCHAVKTLEDFHTILDPLNIKGKDIILLPINNSMGLMEEGGTHWSLLVFCRIREKFFYFDSLGNDNLLSANIIAKKLSCYLLLQTNDIIIMNGPKQDNSYDCGVYVILAVEYIVASLNKGIFSFDMPVPNFTYIDCVEKRSFLLYVILNSHTITSEIFFNLISVKSRNSTSQLKEMELSHTKQNNNFSVKKNSNIMGLKHMNNKQIKSPTPNIATKNRFEMLINISDCGEQTNQLHRNLKPQHIKINKIREKCIKAGKVQSGGSMDGRFHIFADSHGRDLSLAIQKAYPGLNDSFVCTNSGAPSDYILKNACEMATSMTKKDTGVLFVGTNDLSTCTVHNKRPAYNLPGNILRFITANNHTNWIVVPVLRRYDLEYNHFINKLIREVNYNLKRISREHGVKLVNLKSLGRQYYTYHGLHLNKFGKYEISRQIVECKMNVSTSSKVSSTYSDTTSKLHCLDEQTNRNCDTGIKSHSTTMENINFSISSLMSPDHVTSKSLLEQATFYGFQEDSVLSHDNDGTLENSKNFSGHSPPQRDSIDSVFLE